MPLIPATAQLFDEEFVSKEWNVIRPVVPPLQPVFTMKKECVMNGGEWRWERGGRWGRGTCSFSTSCFGVFLVFLFFCSAQLALVWE